MAQATGKIRFNDWVVSGICCQKTGGRPWILGSMAPDAWRQAKRGEQGARRDVQPVDARPRQEAPC